VKIKTKFPVLVPGSYFFIGFYAIFLSFSSLPVHSQSSVGIRFSPVIISPPNIGDSSPAELNGLASTSYDAGIDFTHMFNDHLGLKSSIDMGSLSSTFRIKAPVNAFSNNQNNPVDETILLYPPHNYNAVSGQVVYKVNLKKLIFYNYIGPSLRFYHPGNSGGNSKLSWSPVDFKDPNAIWDLEMNRPHIYNPNLHITFGLGLEKRLSEKSSLQFDVRKNWGLNQIQTGILQTHMQGQFYYDKIKTSANYTGIDIIFNYHLKSQLDKNKYSGALKKDTISNSSTLPEGYRKGSLGIRFTPFFTPATHIKNPSSTDIRGMNWFAFEAGIDYTHMFNSSWGWKVGLDMGVIPQRFHLKAPANAFGSKQTSRIDELLYAAPYNYNAISGELVYRFNAGNTDFYSYAGPSLRFYHWGNFLWDIKKAYNKSYPYDYFEPNTEPPDLLINMPMTHSNLYVNVTSGIGIEKQLSASSSLMFGLRKNWDVNPMKAGLLQVITNNQTYNGSINPRSGYTGIDLKFNYHLKEGKVPTKMPVSIADSGKYHKSIFLQLGLAQTGTFLNFDMRLKPGRNDGWGFRTGAGLSGWLYDTKNAYDLPFVTLPTGINYLAGKRRSQFESGIGFRSEIAVLGSPVEAKALWFEGFLNVGYRFQPINKGPMFRAAWSPVFDAYDIYWAGGELSVGYSYYNLHRDHTKKQKYIASAIPDGKYRKSIFGELLGNGLITSVNYDTRFKPDRNDGFGLRVGIGYFPSLFTLPMGINYIVGKRRSGFESGIGITPFYDIQSVDERKFTTVALLTVGYRFQPIDNGFLFRVNGSIGYDKRKLVFPESGGFIIPWPGLSIGYSFK
jgi:hypothetical protein